MGPAWLRARPVQAPPRHCRHGRGPASHHAQRIAGDVALLWSYVGFVFSALDVDVFVSTWNSGNAPFPADYLDQDWLPTRDLAEMRLALVVLGFQETTPKLDLIADQVSRHLGPRFTLLDKRGLWDIKILVWAQTHLVEGATVTVASLHQAQAQAQAQAQTAGAGAGWDSAPVGLAAAVAGAGSGASGSSLDAMIRPSDAAATSAVVGATSPYPSSPVSSPAAGSAAAATPASTPAATKAAGLAVQAPLQLALLRPGGGGVQRRAAALSAADRAAHDATTIAMAHARSKAGAAAGQAGTSGAGEGESVLSGAEAGVVAVFNDAGAAAPLFGGQRGVAGAGAGAGGGGGSGGGTVNGLASPTTVIRAVEGGTVATGVMGILGNKGGAAVKLTLRNTTLLFVNSHLAPHAEKNADRVRMYNEISAAFAAMGDGPTVAPTVKFDVVIWMGESRRRVADTSPRAASPLPLTGLQFDIALVSSPPRSPSPINQATSTSGWTV